MAIGRHGCDLDQKGDDFFGIIDEVRIYNRELSDCEIQSLYQGTDKCEICQPATLSSDLKMHIPLLHYTQFSNDDAIQPLWVDLEISNFQRLLFKVIDYGVHE